MPRVDAPRSRRSFARLNKPVDVPNLIDIQRKSFAELTNPEGGGLRETIDDISPIEDYTGHLAVQFGDFVFDEPANTIEECREKDLTYSRPLNVTVAFINHETGEIREQTVFMGDFPWMTERGTFIINGTERVVVTQLVRSPGAYLMEPKDREKQVFTANLMPARGSWLELEIDKKGKVFVRIDRKRKLPVTVLLRAMTYNPEVDGAIEDLQPRRPSPLEDTFRGRSVELRHPQLGAVDADARGLGPATHGHAADGGHLQRREPRPRSGRGHRSKRRPPGQGECRAEQLLRLRWPQRRAADQEVRGLIDDDAVRKLTASPAVPHPSRLRPRRSSNRLRLASALSL
mgnify:CR=1 FL=1